MGYDIPLEGTRLVVSPDPFDGRHVRLLEITGRELASLVRVGGRRARGVAVGAAAHLSGVVTGGSSRL